MVKTTVYLPEKLKRGLGRLARQQQVSEAELVRRAVGRLVEGEETSLRSPLPPPLFRSGDPLLAERVDKHLVGFGED